MITKSQKEKLQKHLKKDWISEVCQELESQDIMSSKGTAYSESMIRMVFIGKIEHKGIERIIFKVFETRKQIFENYEKLTEQILSNE